jgi:hypothetical protein
MNDLDPRLLELLRRRSAPTTLDDAHRDAIRAAARQAWFRQQTRRRRQGIALAAAACLAAGLAGWTLHAGLDAPQVAAAPVVAIQEQAPQRQRQSKDEAATTATVEERAIAPAVLAAKPAVSMPAQPMAPAAAGFAAAEMQATNLAEADAAPADMAAEAPLVAAKSAMHTRRAMPAAAALAAAPLADRRDDVALIAIPTDAPQRGRLLAAAAVLDAVGKHRLAEADRSPALQAALDSLAGLDHPVANQLRQRIVQALQAP